jgi:hypothetical protein
MAVHGSFERVTAWKAGIHEFAAAKGPRRRFCHMNEKPEFGQGQLQWHCGIVGAHARQMAFEVNFELANPKDGTVS